MASTVNKIKEGVDTLDELIEELEANDGGLTHDAGHDVR
jgi:hypothetical protein